jgi:hypothetical protein
MCGKKIFFHYPSQNTTTLLHLMLTNKQTTHTSNKPTTEKKRDRKADWTNRNHKHLCFKEESSNKQALYNGTRDIFFVETQILISAYVHKSVKSRNQIRSEIRKGNFKYSINGTVRTVLLKNPSSETINHLLLKPLTAEEPQQFFIFQKQLVSIFFRFHNLLRITHQLQCLIKSQEEHFD